MAEDVSEIKKDEGLDQGVQSKYHLEVTIDGVEIGARRINLLAIREWVFEKTPRIELQFDDNGKSFAIFPIEDQSLIKVKIASLKDNINYVDASFRVQSYSITQAGTTVKVYAYAIVGLLETKEFYSLNQTRSFKNKNSSGVIDSIALECGLKSDIRKSSKDQMTWYQINMTDSNMIDHLLERSFITQNDCPLVYCDRHSNLVFTSLKQELNKEIKFKTEYFPNTLIDGNDEKPDDKVLKLKDFTIRSNGGIFNSLAGYKTSLEYYDLTDTQTIEINDDSHELTSHSLKTKDKVGKLTKNLTHGMLTSNMHGNYFKAILSNFYQRFNYFPMFISVSFDMKDQPEYFQKNENGINLLDKVDIQLSNAHYEVNPIYSGAYIITNITHQVNSDGSYLMTLMLFRNGLNMKSAGSADETKLS